MERFKDLREDYNPDIDYLANAWDAIENEDLEDEEDLEAAPIEVKEPIDYEGLAWDAEEKGLLDGEEQPKTISDLNNKKKGWDWKSNKKAEINSPAQKGKTLYVRKVVSSKGKTFYIIGDETAGSRDSYYDRHKTLEHGKSMSTLLAKIPLDRVSRDHQIHDLLKQQKWCGWDGEAKEGTFDTREAFYLKGKETEEELLEFLALQAAGRVDINFFAKDLVDIDTICHALDMRAADKTLEVISDVISEDTHSLLFIGYLKNLLDNETEDVYNDDMTSEIVYDEVLDCAHDGRIIIISPTSISGYWKRFMRSIIHSKNRQNIEIKVAEDSYIKDKVEELKGMKFDTIIANPPFAYGNEITKTVLENIDFDNYINIMPMSTYKKNNLAAHIIKTEPLPKDAFKDASVQAYVSVLGKEAREVSKEELRIQGYRTDLQRFYRENLSRERTYSYTNSLAGMAKTEEACKEILRTFNNTKDFLLTARTVQDGVHTTQNCMDYKWNIEKSIKLDELPITWDKSLKSFYIQVRFLQFKTSEEHKNFCNYWYRANLSEKLIKGLNKSGGSCEDAIPRVDWSRPWTDEEILREFGYKPSEIREILK